MIRVLSLNYFPSFLLNLNEFSEMALFGLFKELKKTNSTFFWTPKDKTTIYHDKNVSQLKWNHH